MNNILKDRLQARQLAQAEHPSADTLVAFIERSLQSAPRDNVLAHLAVCPACRQTVTLATPESTAAATIPARTWSFHFSTGMRWASATAALAVAVGIGVLLHERPSSTRQMAATSPPAQVSAPAPAKPEQENVEAKSQPNNAGPERKTLSASVLKKRQNQPSRSFGGKIGNDMSLRAGIAGGVVGGLAVAKAASAMHGNNASVNGFVNSRKQVPEGVVAQNEAVTTPASVPAPAAPQPGVAGELRAFDAKAVAPEKNEVISSNQARALPPQAAPMVSQTVEVAAPPEPSVTAKAQKIPSAVAIGGPTNEQAFNVRQITIANWSISDEGQLQRTLRNGVAARVEPEPDVTVEAVAAEGIEVWAAGVQPNAASKQPVRQVLFHSSDAGKTWIKIEGPWRSQIVRLSLALGNLTVVAKDGIWSTLNAGKSWLKR